MNVAEIMEQRNAFSFEVFPPKTDVGMEKLCGEGGVLEKLYTLNRITSPAPTAPAARTSARTWRS